MLLLVMGANYVIMFIGWEGVGLCSYLLIGYWFKNIDYKGRQKAFVMNRIGDLGFLLALFWLLERLRSLNYVTFSVQRALVTSVHALNSKDIIGITLLALCRRYRQERADPAVHLAARCDGRSRRRFQR
jgi:NADH-quinone oxidoreductase subunit L